VRLVVVRGAMAGRAAVAGREGVSSGAGGPQAAARPAAARGAALEDVEKVLTTDGRSCEESEPAVETLACCDVGRLTAGS
jgi:hypothetical protein